MKRGAAHADPQTACARFNEALPVGSRVLYFPVLPAADEPHPRTPPLATVTRSEAYVLSGHSAVVMLQGKAGCVAVDHLWPAPEALP